MQFNGMPANMQQFNNQMYGMMQQQNTANQTQNKGKDGNTKGKLMCFREIARFEKKSHRKGVSQHCYKLFR